MSKSVGMVEERRKVREAIEEHLREVDDWMMKVTEMLAEHDNEEVR